MAKPYILVVGPVEKDGFEIHQYFLSNFPQTFLAKDKFDVQYILRYISIEIDVEHNTFTWEPKPGFVLPAAQKINAAVQAIHNKLVGELSELKVKSLVIEYEKDFLIIIGIELMDQRRDLHKATEILMLDKISRLFGYEGTERCYITYAKDLDYWEQVVKEEHPYLTLGHSVVDFVSVSETEEGPRALFRYFMPKLIYPGKVSCSKADGISRSIQSLENGRVALIFERLFEIEGITEVEINPNYLDVTCIPPTDRKGLHQEVLAGLRIFVHNN